MLPNFLVIGAAKAGTTSLYQYLRQHPQAFMARTKELNFFVEHMNWKRGREWYEQQFRPVRPGVVAVGEASPSYSRYPVLPGVPDRVAALIPDVRLIYLVRHPIERMRSHYLHQVIIGQEHRPIGEALLTAPGYLVTSQYALQIEQYLRHFPLERILIVKSEDLRDARIETMRRVYTFLGISGTYVPPGLNREFLRTTDERRPRPLFRKVWRSPMKQAVAMIAPDFVKRMMRRLPLMSVPAIASTRPRIPPDVEQQLEQLIREDVKRLRTYMGDHFDGWGLA